MDLSHIENFHRVLDATSAEIRRMIARKNAEIAQLEDLDRRVAYVRSINPPKPLADVLPTIAPIFQSPFATAPAGDENDPLAEAVARAIVTEGTVITGPGPVASIAAGRDATFIRPGDLDNLEDLEPTGDVRSIARRFAPAGQ